MSTPAILAIDPGGTTGWARMYSGRDGIVDVGQVEGRHGFYTWHAAGPRSSDERIVVEKFTITPATAKMSAQYDALYIIGYLEAWAHLVGRSFTLQTPSEAKGIGTDDALKALGWWRPGLPHGMDAARHLFRYLVSSHDPRATELIRGVLDA